MGDPQRCENSRSVHDLPRVHGSQSLGSNDIEFGPVAQVAWNPGCRVCHTRILESGQQDPIGHTPRIELEAHVLDLIAVPYPWLPLAN